MRQSKALYCLAVGYIVGASLNKTNSYELVNNGYSLRAPFTPVTFVKLSDLGQPIHYAGQTYLFGFSPQELYRIAALTKKDLDDGLQAELNWVNLTKRKLQSNWEKVAAEVAREAQAVERAGGVPEIPQVAAANSAVPATPPAMAVEEPVPTAAAAPSSMQEKPVAPSNEPPVTGEVTRPVNGFNLYIASAKSKYLSSPAIGYSAVIQNIATGKATEIGKGGHTKDFNKLVVLALRDAFAAGVIPPSSKTAQTSVAIYTANEFVANMFARNYLRNFARNSWKKKDGGTLAYKDEWESIWNQVSHMVVRAVLCEPDGADLRACTTKAQAFADEYHRTHSNRIAPNHQ